MFDQDNKGYITEQDLVQKFGEIELDADPARVLARYDRDRDGRLSYGEFSKMVSPLNYEYHGRGGSSSSWGRSSFGGPKSTFTPAQLQAYCTEEWLDDLKEVLFAISRTEEYLIEMRNAYNINGESLFAQIDAFKVGYITSRSLGEWLSDFVGFRLNDFEIKLILNRYDKDNSYTINLGEFIEEVNPEIVNEEYDNNEQEEEQPEEGKEGEAEAQNNFEEESEEDNEGNMRRRYLSGNEDDLRDRNDEEELRQLNEAGEEIEDDDAKYLEGL
jgi:Ca2+-binding EF-hand superfamily protein